MVMTRRSQEGFALPTIIIASVIMLVVLVSSVTAVSSITTSLASQYYNQLAREAAESGLAHARACLRQSDYAATWTDALPLKPNTNCSGGSVVGLDAWLVTSGVVRSAYSVPLPTAGAVGSLRVVSTGTVQLVRTSDPTQIWRTYTYTAGENSRYNDTPQIASGAGWKAVGTQYYSGHNGYMLAGNGTLYGWGDNGSNQLGDSSLGTTISTPIQMELPSGVQRVKKVHSSGQGASVVCIIATHSSLGDQIYCRGSGDMGGTTWQRFGLTTGLTVQSMDINSYGADSVCAIASDNQAYCAGLNDSGGLGKGGTTDTLVPFASPMRFRLDLANPAPLGGTTLPLTAKKVFTKDRFTCVIASDNQAYCAGDNNFGQLGQGTFTTNVWVGKSIPGRAIVPGNPAIVDIKLPYHGGYDGIFFRTANNDLFMSGHNGQGTANDGAYTGTCSNGGSVNCYSTPRAITTGAFSDMISYGERGDEAHGLCALAQVPPSNSGLWCMGARTYGQTGAACSGSVPTTNFNGPIALAGNVVKTAMNAEAGYQMNSVMVITRSGDVYAAGDNTYGKLGTGAALNPCNATYAKVALPVGVKAVALANNDEYSAFILGDNGKVYAMGRNNNGQLGDGTTTTRSTPVEVKIPRQATIY